MKTMLQRWRVFLWVAVWVLCFPGQAQANAGVPMIFLTWPGMALALIPVIFLEMRVIGKRLGLTPRRAFKVAAWANLLTTFVGVPLTWVILTVLEGATGGGRAYGIDTPAKKLLAVTWQAPWLIPYEANHNLYWMVPAAMMWLLVPTFFMSWWLEYLAAARMLRDADRARLKSAMFKANLLSYAFLELCALGWLLFEIVFVV